MPDQACCNARLGRILWVSAAVAVLAGCGSFDGASRRVANAITPYKIDIVQGNFVSREQVQALQPGMSRQQVRDILGTPLVASLFHADRWDYVFTLKRPGEDVQTRKLVVTFEGEHFVRAEGDEMPTEAEFVASLGVRTRSSKIPPLQATPEQLARYPAPSQPAASSAAATPAADSGAPRTSYPPLE